MLMAALPEEGDARFLSLQDIADQNHLSAGFLSQIMMPLKKASLVKAREGIHGGYQLAKPREQTTLAEVYEALDGPLALTTCQRSNEQCVCEHSCGTKGIWKELHQIMNEYLKGRTLADVQSIAH